MAEDSAQLAVDDVIEGASQTAAAASKEAGQSNLVQDQQNQVQISATLNASSLLRATRLSGAGSGPDLSNCVKQACSDNNCGQIAQMPQSTKWLLTALKTAR